MHKPIINDLCAISHRAEPCNQIINDLCAINDCAELCNRKKRCSVVASFCVGKIEFDQTVEDGISSLLCYAPTHCEVEDSCMRIARFALNKIRVERSRAFNPHSYRGSCYETA